jgi:hypothetical protein
VSLAELVAALGGVLTHEDPLVRRRGALLLASAVAAVARTGGREAMAADPSLNSPERVRVLLAFFADRLSDYPSVGPCLLGCRALLEDVCERHPDLAPAAAAVPVCRALFAEVPVQTLELPLRQTAVGLLLYLLRSSCHLAAICSSRGEELPFAVDFGVGLVSAVDGEKDPRCLLLCLHAMEQALLPRPQGLGDTIASLTEELFNVTSCYFPITFTPPPNDPFGITRDMLVQALRRVFGATPRMARLVVPLLLDKLASDMPEAKRDALETLKALAPRYGVQTLAPLLASLASGVRAEVLARAAAEPLALSQPFGSGGSDEFAGAGVAGEGSLGASADTGSADERAQQNSKARRQRLLAQQASEIAALWTNSIGLSAGAIGLDFSGASEAHRYSGYGLYVPASLSFAPSPAEDGSGGTGAAAAEPLLAAEEAGAAAAPPSITEEALSAVADLTQLLSRHVQVTGSTSEWHAFVSALVSACLVDLRRAADSTAGRASARLLCALASSSHHALSYVADAAVPVVREVIEEAAANHRYGVRAALLALLAGVVHTVDPRLDHPAGQHPLAKHTDFLVACFTSVLTERPLAALSAAMDEPHDHSAHTHGPNGECKATSAVLQTSLTEARCIAAAGLCDLAVRPASPLLTLDQKWETTRIFTDLCTTDADDAARQACLRALCTMASIRQRFCDAVLEIALPSLFAAIPGRHAQHALFSLGQLACISNLRVQHTVVPQLLCRAVRAVTGPHGTWLELVPLHACANSCDHCDSEESCASTAVSAAILETLCMIVASKGMIGATAGVDALLRHTPDSMAVYTDLLKNNAAARSSHTAAGLTLNDRPPLLVPTFFRLVTDSLRPSTQDVPAVDVLPSGVRAAMEMVFRVTSIKASALVQDAFRTALATALLAHVDAASRNDDSSMSDDTPSALPTSLATLPAPDADESLIAPPWFAPLGISASIRDFQVLPIFFKGLACSRKGARTAYFQRLAPLLTAAIFRVPCGHLNSCMDLRQQLQGQLAEAAMQRTGAGDSHVLTPVASECCGGGSDGAKAHSGACGCASSAPGVVVPADAAATCGGPAIACASALRERDYASLERMDLQRCVVITAQTVGMIVNREPASGADKRQFDATLLDVLEKIATLSGVRVVGAPDVALQSITRMTEGLSLSADDRETLAFARERGVVLLVWLGKGLCARGHAAGLGCAESLLHVAAGATRGFFFEVPASPHLLTLAGKGLGTVVADALPGHAFSREAGTLLQPLYKQRLFGHMYKLAHVALDSPRGAAGGGNHVQALSPAGLFLSLCSLAAQLPRSVILSDAVKVLPIVVRALEVISDYQPPRESGGAGASLSAGAGWLGGASNAAATATPADGLDLFGRDCAELRDAIASSALLCLRILIKSAGAAVATHVHTLAPVLVLLACSKRLSILRAQNAAGMDPAYVAPAQDIHSQRHQQQHRPLPSSRPLIRAAAIDCLRSLVSLPYHRIHPMRNPVIQGLLPALDDPKRAIRRRAAACRNEWITLSSGLGS